MTAHLKKYLTRVEISPAGDKRRTYPQCASQQGVTLIELILSIVIIAVALTGILSVMNLTTRKSADPLLISQSIAIAESYLEEILLQAYTDPDGTNAGETRATFDNVADYSGLVESVTDQRGVSISGLTGFAVSVTVSGDMAFAGPTRALQVTVTVSKAGVSTVSLVGYRFDY
jgi:MSHA pilin protein MshD